MDERDDTAPDAAELERLAIEALGALPEAFRAHARDVVIRVEEFASDAMLDKAYGRSGRLAFRRTEMKAVAYVEELIATYGLDVDRHSEGETGFAHRPREMAGFGARAKAVAENYGVTATIIEKADLEAQGMWVILRGDDDSHRLRTEPAEIPFRPRFGRRRTGSIAL